MAPALEPLVVQQELLNARIALVPAQRERMTSSYAALAAVGRLAPSVLGLPTLSSVRALSSGQRFLVRGAHADGPCRLRLHITLHSLAEVNAAIAELLTRLNEADPAARRDPPQALEEIGRPAFKALPESPYVFAEWRICRVSIDYHVEVEALLQRPASLRPRRGRGALHRPHRREFPQG